MEYRGREFPLAEMRRRPEPIPDGPDGTVRRSRLIRSRGPGIPRILLILPEFPPHIGGMQTHAAYLSRHLAENRYEIQVVTYQSTNSTTALEARRYDRSLPFMVHRFLGRLSYWHGLDALAQLAAGFRPDIVYASNVFYGFLQRRVNVPVICRSVGNDVLRPWIAYPYRPASRFLGKPQVEKTFYEWFSRASYPEWIETAFRRRRFDLMRESTRAMSRILANSDFTATLLKELGIPGGRIDVLVGGVDSKRFQKPPANECGKWRRRLKLPPDGFILMTACRLVAKKGIDFLLNAFMVLQVYVPDAHLVIVGDGKHAKRYRTLADNLGLGDTVTFTGSVSHQEIHHYYWCCDLFVLASRECCNPLTGTRDVETMGRVLCEANAAGIPVVASRSGGIPSVIEHGHNGLLFAEGDQHNFVEQVRRIRKDRELLHRLVRNGAERAKNRFDWSVILQHHENIFAEFLRR